ncbi:MAG: alpha-amylase family glycosyl hydrolase [Saprospiraceae bacterium]
MMKNILILISICFLLVHTACSSDDPIIYPPITNPDPPQYGVPFSSVPARQDAIIYQVNIRPFSATGNLAGVIARLDSIKALGVNVIYLMPIYPVGTINTVNSPYCVKDYKTVNPEFGTLTDLRSLVDDAHNRNMSVILDWVANHTAWDNEWTTTHKDWYLQDGSGNIVSPPGTGWNDVAQLNFTNGAMRLEMIKSMKFWVYTANIDGYRCDYTDGPPIDFWAQAIDTLRNISTHKLLLMAEGSRSNNFNAGFDYNFGFGFYGQLKGIYKNHSAVTTIDNLNSTEYTNATSGQSVVRYTTNHDVNSSDGTPLDLYGGRNGSMTAFVIASCMKSVPMIYGSQEVGTSFKILFPFTGAKINWSVNPDITAEYKKIISFRAGSKAIKEGTLTSYSNADICAFTKTVAGEKAMVIVNTRNGVINYTIPSSLANTTWTDILNGGMITLTPQLTLQPYNYFLLKQ